MITKLNSSIAKMRIAGLALCTLATMSLVFATTLSATAAQKLIVAFGASNTYGKGVSRSEAYPAQLQQLLRSKGYDVRVVNAGVNGQTTGGMLRRLKSAVPNGTSVVIFQPGNNDKRKGKAGRADRISTIKHNLSARGIQVIMLPNTTFRNYPQQNDGQHLTPKGYNLLANSLLPKVVSAMGQ